MASGTSSLPPIEATSPPTRIPPMGSSKPRGSQADPGQLARIVLRLRELRVETIHGGHYESFDRDRLLEIIDLYLAGKGRMGDATAWVASKL